MGNANEVGLGLAALGIAAAFAAGVFAGRSAGQMVEEDIAQVAAAGAERASFQQTVLARDHAAAQAHEVARFKVAVTHAQPSAGPSDALVTIVEWCDLYGEACRETDSLLSAALERYPLEVRRVYRSLGGGLLGGASRAEEQVLEVARAAHEQGKFWELRKRLSEHDGAPSLGELRGHALTIGMEWGALERALERRTHGGEIAADRALARALAIGAAPALHVNGRPLEGEITAEKLSMLIEEEIARARRLVDEGASREHIYAEIIKPAAFHPVRSSL
jgi:protein-disulfide isomerase